MMFMPQSSGRSKVKSGSSLTGLAPTVSIEKEMNRKASKSTNNTRGARTRSSFSSPSSLSKKKKRDTKTYISSTRTVVDHTYYDHLHDPPVTNVPNNDGTSVASTAKKGPRGGVAVAFPEKLHDMLSAAATEGFDSVVSWLPHGRSFIVRSKQEFVEDVMPRFFHQSKITSFQRQLNLYGFVRLTAGPDRGSYYHELFLRSRKDLCHLMVRTRVKGNGMKAASSPETEPNFYDKEPCPIKYDTMDQDDAASDDDRDPPPFLTIPDVTPSCGAETESSSESTETPTTPAVVSLPSSPQQGNKTTISRLQVPSDISFEVLMPAVQGLVDDDDDEEDIDDDDGQDFDGEHSDFLPHSGDEVFFEGSKFRYLDHIDIVNLDMKFFDPSVTAYAAV